MARLGDVVKIEASSKRVVGDKFWLLNLDMVEQQTGNIIDYNYVGKDVLNGSIIQFDTGCVLYSKLRPNLNKVVIPSQDGFATSEMLPLRPDTKMLTREYLTAFLRSDSFVTWAVSKTAGAKMPRLGSRELLDKELPLPSITEQTRIAAQFAKVGELIALRREQLAKLDQLVKSRFVELFGDCNKQTSIKESGLTISDGNYSSKYPRSEEFVESGIPFIRANNLKNGTVVDEDMYFITAEKHNILLKGHLRPNDVLITTRGNIGQVAIVPEKHNDSNINAQIVLLRDKNGRFVPQYLLWALQTEEVKAQYIELQTGTALKQLPVGRLEQVMIKEPQVDLQKQFAAFVEQTDKSKLAIQQSLDKLETLKKSLMQEYFG